MKFFLTLRKRAIFLYSVLKLFFQKQFPEGKIRRKTPVPEPQACNFFKKETLAQVFSCKFCEISKDTFSYRIPPLAASVLRKQGFLHLISCLIH